MHFSSLLTPVAIALLSVSELASAHVVFVKAVGSGDDSFAGYGLGYDPANRRDGGGFFPWQKDVSVFDSKNVHTKWNKNYNNYGCGVTTDSLVTQVQKVNQAEWQDVAKKGAAWPWPYKDTISEGYNDIKWGIDHMAWLEWGQKTRYDNALKQTLKTGIPKVVPGGKVKITAWMVNQDGGGPFRCFIDYKGNANQWSAWDLPITTNCEGNAESIRSWGAPAPCDIEVTLPANMNCEGTYTAPRICILRCQNYAENGPFGGCVPIQQLQPVVKEVVQAKPVPVPVVQPVEPVVLPPEPVTVTKNNLVTIIKDDHTTVSVVTKNSVLTLTQVIQPPPKTTVEIQTKIVTIKTKVLPTKKPTDIGKPITPTARPPTNQKPTYEELEAGLGGEDYDDDVIEELKNTPITEEEKKKLKKQVGQKNESPDGYYKQKLRFHRD
ncbi:hypothetical protein AOL_s00091g61 [Orbilia oligospora ATCC 24927]|uniref:Uncharacterized protein n=1 Tax=Arthrobotrys oligospora (strain ATCC 24927 / CBS 115.81 / DSM 1491) TaxID=756982 RepID=G1XI09_ARTOA|nr:hypothetical protein AOL_s00091g61 [Orbilia oligospora ATCC 24927]EGX47240.1 hypothetical protein AOL_s00091g61 [Orbilia oligospora ATCC 24927]